MTPEYNTGIPGVPKNAIDWASRPPDGPFHGNPIAIVTASPGRLGGTRCQYQFRQCFVPLNAYLLVQPEMMLAGANRLVDGNARLADGEARGRLLKTLGSGGSRVTPPAR